MKKIVTVVGSRQINGRPMKIAQDLKESSETLNNLEINNQIITPLEYNILPSTGCKNCFKNNFCPTENNISDKAKFVKEQILKSDLLIIISPVYSHNVSGDIKNLIDRISYWSHLFRLAGKPIILIASAESNGTNFVLDYLNKVFTAMGGVVIKQSSFLTIDHANFQSNIKNITETVMTTFSKNFLFTPNEYQERLFQNLKENIKKYPPHNSERQYWEKEKLLYFPNLKNYFKSFQEI
ncbi:flavodoxin family protein [Staphylococcus aureus]|uniref:flavodoxin family protein n=1 Tax=Staphylococcus aureus TaxID=1280 RepID=UPI0021CF794D|nr:flavodoxin family protein [Staphylococcus aureus]UXU11625.1 flavodoxin family protein [Staphylococcus aureus]UXU35511.1 flavodoxin family protein [Staphylococcus aureus]HEE8868271.1 flavodoxin family protein [Staphylococcus aureus]